MVSDSSDITVPVDKKSPDEKTAVRKIQVDGRLSLPEEFYRFMGLVEGDKVEVKCDEHKVEITPREYESK